jgi:LmbE family N-acetylglucosaminyl deacetylase
MTRKLMAVLAHPDDESLGLGGTLATYAARGVETYVVTATRGERGRYFANVDRPSDADVGRVREAELRAATRTLGVRELVLLDYIDGELDQADPDEAVGRIVAEPQRASCCAGVSSPSRVYAESCVSCRRTALHARRQWA